MMQSDTPPGSSKAVEWLRWLCVLPAAFLIRFLAQIALGLLTRGAGQVVLAVLVRKFIVYSVSEALFVIVGAKLAPRRQILVAIVLAVLEGALSLLKHVIVQYAAGNRVGSTNYSDFALEAIGLACGVVVVMASVRRKSRQWTAPNGIR